MPCSVIVDKASWHVGVIEQPTIMTLISLATNDELYYSSFVLVGETRPIKQKEWNQQCIWLWAASKGRWSHAASMRTAIAGDLSLKHALPFSFALILPAFYMLFTNYYK